MSQRALADRLGVHPSWVAKVEMRERRIDVLDFVRIARASGHDPAEVFSEWLHVSRK